MNVLLNSTRNQLKTFGPIQFARDEQKLCKANIRYPRNRYGNIFNIFSLPMSLFFGAELSGMEN